MDIEQLRLRASGVRQLLAQNDFPLKHGQVLDLLAAVPGLRNWPEVCAFPDRLRQTAVDQAAAGRLARRIEAMGGPALGAELLLPAIEGGEARTPLAIWAEGPPPGIYVCTDSDFALAAVERYVEGAEGKVFYTEGLAFDSDYAIELGESGIFSPGLRHAPSGTLVVGSLQLTQEEWGNNRNRMTAAWKAASADLRVVLFCQTVSPETVYRDVALLTRGPDEPSDVVDPKLVGIVDGEGQFLERRPFVPAAAPVIAVQTKPDGLELPDHIARELARAVTIEPQGWIVAGMEQTDVSDPVRVVLAILAHLTHLGPVARVHPHSRGDFGGAKKDLPGFLALPRCASVESAIADGYKVLVMDSPYHGAIEAMGKYAGEALFIVPTSARGVGRAFWQVFSSYSGESFDAVLEGLVAAICVSTVRGTRSKPVVWDMYARVPSLLEDNSKRKKPLGVEEVIERARAIRWEDQAFELLKQGKVSEKALRKDFPYLRIPRALTAKATTGGDVPSKTGDAARSANSSRRGT
jgi:hypothetical protein